MENRQIFVENILTMEKIRQKKVEEFKESFSRHLELVNESAGNKNLQLFYLSLMINETKRLLEDYRVFQEFLHNSETVRTSIGAIERNLKKLEETYNYYKAILEGEYA